MACQTVQGIRYVTDITDSFKASAVRPEANGSTTKTIRPCVVHAAKQHNALMLHKNEQSKIVKCMTTTLKVQLCYRRSYSAVLASFKNTEPGLA